MSPCSPTRFPIYALAATVLAPTDTQPSELLSPENWLRLARTARLPSPRFFSWSRVRRTALMNCRPRRPFAASCAIFCSSPKTRDWSRSCSPRRAISSTVFPSAACRFILMAGCGTKSAILRATRKECPSMPENCIYIARSSAIAARALAGEMMVMNSVDSTFFTLNEVATTIFQAADGRTPLRDIVRERVCEQFDIDPEQAQADAEQFVAELSGHGILLVSSQPLPAEAP